MDESNSVEQVENLRAETDMLFDHLSNVLENALNLESLTDIKCKNLMGIDREEEKSATESVGGGLFYEMHNRLSRIGQAISIANDFITMI